MPLKAKDFDTISHFTPNENWGDIEIVKFKLVKALDDLRTFIKQPIYITCAVSENHTINSQHFTGEAADVMFPGTGLKELFNLFLAASRFSVFTEIGVYSYWSMGHNTRGGLHLGVRPQPIRDYWFSGERGEYDAITMKGLLLSGIQ